MHTVNGLHELFLSSINTDNIWPELLRKFQDIEMVQDTWGGTKSFL